MRTVSVKLTGVTPLIMHRDNIGWASNLDAWRRQPANKSAPKGDDRFPGWTWLGYVYHDGKHLGIPSDNIMAMLRDGGAKVPTGKKGATYKRQSQSGLIVLDTVWPIVTSDGRMVSVASAEKVAEIDEFEAGLDVARGLGFDVLVKRATVGTSKHVRCRPIFAAGWSTSGTIAVTDDTITEDVLSEILSCAGDLCGLCDWRPGSKKSPGPFGRFTAEIEK